MFTATFPVRFAHCDPAMIVYYPRYFELCDAAVEDWTAAVLKLDRAAMHGTQGLGLPTVRLEAQFTAPSRLGDVLDFAISIRRIGNSSVDLDIRISCAGQPRVTMEARLVLLDLDQACARVWPPDMLERLQAQYLCDKDPK